MGSHWGCRVTMPIPELTADGLLPVGVHDCTIEDVQARFGLFRTNDARPKLMGRFREYFGEAQACNLVAWIAVDGSFVTAKDSPNDIDFVVALRADHDFTTTIPPFAYNVVSRHRVKKKYPFDVAIAPEGTDELNRWMEFFQTTRENEEKGILRIRL